MHLIRGSIIILLAGLLAGCNENSIASCDPDDWCAGPEPVTDGLNTVTSEGRIREFYVQLPADYETSMEPKPLLFAYHGTGGTYDLWVDGYYDLADVVGDGAIMVFMQATEDQNGVNQWDYDFDLQYFEDVLTRLSEVVEFDPNRIFVTGHSSGGGMAHDLGCNYGNVVRGIAPHAAILKSFTCTGSVAVLQTHGTNDTLSRASTGEAGHQFWVAYNGFGLDTTIEGVHPTCIDHSLDASPYPVQWCLHSEEGGEFGHDWPSFASEATWEFFSSLPDAEPTSEPPAGGGNSEENQFDTLVSFTLVYPPDIIEIDGECEEGDPKIKVGALGLYPAGSQQPLGGGPPTNLNLGFDAGNVGPNSVQDYELPIKYGSETFPGTYTFTVVIYVCDGGNPIPFPQDYMVLHDIDVVDRNTPVIIDTPLVLESVFY
jgi:predicted esterase